MRDLNNYTIDSGPGSENLLRDQLTDLMLIIWAIIGSIGFVLTQIRALEIGWTARDFFQLLTIVCIVFIALYCRILYFRDARRWSLLFSVGGSDYGTFLFATNCLYLYSVVDVVHLLFSDRFTPICAITPIITNKK